MKKEIFEIVDRQTGKVVGRMSSYIAARKRSDRLDCEYGAYRYYVRESL